jgi:drug/metabolite transporter (DMT)-like permease
VSATLLKDQSASRRPLAGTALVLLSTLAWSFSGLFTRLLTTDVITAIAWRSFFGALFTAIPLLFQSRRDVRAILVFSWPMVALVLSVAACSACTVGALFLTSIANTAVIYATTPFMAAALSYLFVGERQKGRTLVASAVSLAGVVIIVSSGFGSGGFLGDLVAVGMTLTFAFMIVLPKVYPELDLQAASILGAALTFAAFAPFGAARAMPLHDWTVLAGFGFTNFTVALYLFLVGARHLAAAQAALIGTLDVVLAPFWVWLAFGERPSVATLIGGGMIFLVVVWHTAMEWRDEVRRRHVAPSGGTLDLG